MDRGMGGPQDIMSGRPGEGSRLEFLPRHPTCSLQEPGQPEALRTLAPGLGLAGHIRLGRRKLVTESRAGWSQGKRGRNWTSTPGPQDWRTAGGERASGLRPSFSWNRCPRQGHSDSFPFQPGKPPPYSPALGCGAWRKKPGAPKGSVPAQVPASLPGLARPKATQAGAPTDRCPWCGRRAWQPWCWCWCCPLRACAGALCEPCDRAPPRESRFQDKSVLKAAGLGGMKRPG